VLSFPAAAPRPGAPVLLGDIVIAYETAAREAAAENKLFMQHLVHLAVHGFLHLIGYDHAAEQDAAAMERLETAILARLGVPDPYRLLGAKT
jgi:probable rRNA maturation factor